MPSIKRSELVKLLTKYRMCRFPSLSPQAIKMRKKHREDPEFRAKMVAHNQRIAKTKKYSPESYAKMQQVGKDLNKPENIKKRKEVFKSRHIIRKQRKDKVYDDKIYDRPNDYAGVVSMSEYASL